MLKNLCAKLCLSRSSQRPRRGSRQRFKNLCALCASVRNSASHGVHKGQGEESRQSIKNLCALCASVRNSLYIPYRFGSHRDHRGHGGGAEKVLKNLCAKLCLSRSSQRPRRGSRQRFKNLCALCASVRNSASHGVHKGQGEGVDKDLKTSVPLCENLYTSHAVLDLTETTEDTERGQKKC